MHLDDECGILDKNFRLACQKLESALFNFLMHQFSHLKLGWVSHTMEGNRKYFPYFPWDQKCIIWKGPKKTLSTLIYLCILISCTQKMRILPIFLDLICLYIWLYRNIFFWCLFLAFELFLCLRAFFAISDPSKLFPALFEMYLVRHFLKF